MKPQDAQSPSIVGPAPLWALFLFTFLNSVGTGVAQNGIFFVIDRVYGSTRTANYTLGLLLGVTYIVGAMGAQPLVRGLMRLAGLSERGVLALLMIVMGVLCQVTWLAPALGASGVWPIWLMVLLYSPLSGVLWPIVESFVSGGRSGEGLRRTMGTWNVVWSSATVGAYFAMGPLLASVELAGKIVPLLGLVHVAGVIVLWKLPASPGEHLSEQHAPHPPVFEKLLTTFRVLLPVSYVVSTALGPYLPGALKNLGVAPVWMTPIAAGWLIARVGTFWWMGKSAGWHGRWSPAIIGGVALVGGFAVCVMSPRLVGALGTTGATGALFAGLLLFGTGMAVIYTAAIYYALEVGKAEVDAGGKHEALIGIGYTIGPGVGLAASLGVDRGAVAPGLFEPLVLGGVGLIAAGAVGAVAWRIGHARRAAKSAR